MTHHLSRACFALALACAFTTPTFADTPLPPTLTGTLLNPSDQTITLGSPATTSTLDTNSGSALINNGTWNAYAGTIAPPIVLTPWVNAAITNTGTLNIDAGTGIFALLDYTPQPSNHSISSALTFTNTGTVNVNTGSFYLAASDTGSTSGTFTLAANTTLGLGANLTFDQNSTITGAGNVLLSINVRNDPKGNYIPTPTNTPPTITFDGTYDITGSTTIQGVSVTFNRDTTLNNLRASPVNSLITYSPVLSGNGTLTLTGAGNPQDSYSSYKGPAIIDGIVKNKAIIVTGTLLLSEQSRLVVDGTTITVDPGAFLRFSGQSVECHFQNNASIINNGTIVATTLLRGTSPSPSLTLTNNGTVQVRSYFTMDSSVTFNNHGTINVPTGELELSNGTDTNNSVINITKDGRMYAGVARTFNAGTFNNAGVITSDYFITLSKDLVFNHSGNLVVSGGTLTLAASQQAATTGTFTVEKRGTLEFAADYDFSSPTGPSLSHYDYISPYEPSGDGLIIIDPNTTLTLPLDTPFAGTIQVNGTLLIAPPLNPANANMTPNFTILPTQVPEPTSLTLLTLALPLLLKRRRPS